ncbi:MAG TPA: hypothetical protein ENJ56_00450 [Anaerolineae bacterium]|nr:hypothetical protein [Anaerolineae bacterium]
MKVISHLKKICATATPNSPPSETLRLQSALTAEDQAAVLAKFVQLGDDALRPIWDAFDDRIPYDELHLLRLIYRLQ